MKTIEQRVKDVFGEQLFALVSSQQQLEEAQARIAELEAAQAGTEVFAPAPKTA